MGSTGKLPGSAWASHADEVRFPDLTLDLDEVFLFEVKRKVQKDRTVSLNGGPVQVWHERQPIQLAKRLDAYANCFVKRHRPSGTLSPDTAAPEPPSGLALRNLNGPDDDTEPR